MDYIKTIAEVSSISVAAEKLGISQPALSSYLKKKEKELGAVLFDRSKQPLQLTEAGSIYLEYIERFSTLEHEFQQRISDIAELNTGKLSIGGASFFNIAYLPKTVAAFNKKYPNIDIEIIDGGVPEITTKAWNGSLDIFITPDASDTNRFTYEKILEENICLAVPSEWEINDVIQDDHKCENQEPIVLTNDEFVKLCEYPFIVLRHNQDIGRKMEELFEHFNCRPERFIVAEQTMTTLAMTAEGVGISLVSANSMESIYSKNRPVLYIADIELCRRNLFVAYPKNKYVSKPAIEFIKILKEINGGNELR